MLRVAAAAFLALAGACATWPEAYWPDDGWRESAPERLGMDSGRLAGALDFARNEDLHLHSLLVIRRGYVVLDAAFWPYQPGDDHDVASVTKSVVATLVGHAITRGEIRLDDPVVTWISDRAIAHLDERKRAMRVEDLLTMRAGLRNEEKTDLFTMFETPDWIQHTLDRPMAAAPGTVFNYTSGVSHLLATIRSRAENGTAPGSSELFKTLGIRVASWPAGPQGVPYGGGDLHLTPRDLARIGLLYLRRGRWGETVLLDPNWIRAATQRQAQVPENELDYGYHWWVFDGGFAAIGRGGQYLAVVPAEDLIVVAVGGAARASGPIFGRLLREHILAAVLPRPREPGAELEELRRRVRALERQPNPETPAPLPALARRIAGARWIIESDDPTEPDSFTLEFPTPEAGLLTLERGGTRTELSFGLDGVPRLTPRPEGARTDPRALDLPSALMGHWRDERTFVLEWDEVNNINRWTITIGFDGDRASIRYDEATFLPSRERVAHRVRPGARNLGRGYSGGSS
jgi:CubicO group peptidase (beta-lactamase class C family)